MINIHHQPNSNILLTTAVGELDEADYHRLLPEVERIIQRHGKVRWYFEMEDFDGWTPGAFWDDLKFDAQHASDYERVAIVGRKTWMDWMTQLMKPFTSAEIRYFELEDQSQAKQWIAE